MYDALSCREHPKSIALFLIKAMKRVKAHRDHVDDLWHITKSFSTRNNTYHTGDISRSIFSIFSQHQYSIAPPLIASHSLEKGLTSIVALEIIDGSMTENYKVIFNIYFLVKPKLISACVIISRIYII